MVVLSCPNSTTPDKLTLYEKTALSLDYGKIYCDFKASDKFQEVELIECYLKGSKTSKFLTNLLSIREGYDLYMSNVSDSSILTDDLDELISEALSSAEIYYSFTHSVLDEIELVIANRLKNINQVVAIYTQHYRAELQVVVFLNTEMYDNDLMYKMLDIEYELQKRFGEQLLAFSYIPRVSENRREVVSKSAKLIYEK